MCSNYYQRSLRRQPDHQRRPSRTNNPRKRQDFDPWGEWKVCIFFALPWMIPLGILIILGPPDGFNPEFRVHSAALQYPHINATGSSSELTATWDLTLLAKNPNHKWDIDCDSLQALLFYRPSGYQHIREWRQEHKEKEKELVVLAATSLVPFALSKRNQRGISFKLHMLSAYVANDVVKEISDGNTTTLSLRFGLKLSVWSRYRAQLMSDQKTPLPRFASYFCDRIQVRVSSDNNHINDTGNLKIIMKAHQSTACDISNVMFD
ncbi:unnamed protein product [Prunus armeniaca]|uniref:Late embryogenesis abundant protein LEA-2 subgroup domain-containing protein n=1 Tax=Prunus armeniaca TaxID=36596 RepID=A0A6J5VCX9_PRUAR|nr:hypothetical protein GBA52_024057 [Prunus armeniaca]CAB4286889.1 unnamed protein product [Prunus armeniaca]